MPSKRIENELNNRMYFLTFTVKNWYHILDRHGRWNILLDSLQFCRQQKKLKIFSYVFMTNHIHLIVESPDTSGFVRDFKRHNAQKILNNIKETEPNTARLFLGEDGKFEFWKKTNMPILLESDYVFMQKKEYIEDNPVRKQYVDSPEHWIFSSAYPGNPVYISGLNEAGE